MRMVRLVNMYKTPDAIKSLYEQFQIGAQSYSFKMEDYIYKTFTKGPRSILLAMLQLPNNSEP
jgi:hypothetical protein